MDWWFLAKMLGGIVVGGFIGDFLVARWRRRREQRRRLNGRAGNGQDRTY